MHSISAKRVWTSKGWLENARVILNDGRIERIVKNAEENCDVPMLVPGMTELHVHGSLGYSVQNLDDDGTSAWLRRLAKHGVTSVLPSPSTAPIDVMHASVERFARIMENPIKDGAEVLGIHLEGPFVSEIKKGAMDVRHMLAPTIENYQSLVYGCEKAIKLITLAPELPGALELIRYLRRQNVWVNAGHSNATFDEMNLAISQGVNGVTHFFNASRAIHHREPGMLVAAMLSPDVYCELIGDLVHVHAGILRLMMQTIGARRVALITDAVRLTGEPDGRYENIIVTNGSPKKLDGTLSGGCKMMDEIVRGLIADIGLDPWDVFCAACNTPVRRIGVLGLGDIAPLYKANLVAFDDSYHVMLVVIDGEEVRI